MNPRYLHSLMLVSALAFTGCATKKYVATTTAPIKSEVDQVQAQANQQGQKLDQQGQAIDQQKQQLEAQGTKLSATDERATSADQRAGDAINRADQAGQKADTANAKGDKNAHDINDLRGVIANLDDYKAVKEVVVAFGFDKDVLTPDGKQELDNLVANQSALKHYFIAVEGFTDKNGSAEYNAALSRRRADRVVQYLVAQHDIPIYRVHMIGLGSQKPAEDGRTREANAKNRRVEVTIYSADQNASAMNSSPAASFPTSTQR
jgi:outer membrane protein OmpA-like peptidoglycan-associated protein